MTYQATVTHLGPLKWVATVILPHRKATCLIYGKGMTRKRAVRNCQAKVDRHIEKFGSIE